MTNTSSVSAKCCQFCGKPLERREIPEFLKNIYSSAKTEMPQIFKPCQCEGQQAVLRQEQKEEAAKRASERQARREAAYQRAGIPKRYWHAELNEEQKGLLEKVKAGQSLFFTGKCGRGKTYAACAILRQLIKDGYRNVRFSDIEGIEREVTATWGMRGQSEQETIASYVNANVLVIDDLGAETMATITMKILRAVISGREANEAVTIFTSNYTRRDFALRIAAEGDKVMASRLASRISGMTEMIEFNGSDQRLKR